MKQTYSSMATDGKKSKDLDGVCIQNSLEAKNPMINHNMHCLVRSLDEGLLSPKVICLSVRWDVGTAKGIETVATNNSFCFYN